ncbi:type II restriction endonuclease subunit R [Flavobacterium restrictum]|uniref:Type II restriction endonuclease subunit R n=1 Tax=Flavobacterium restrictum TaxID=2594428 RepID=A0A553E8X3_9FLAO|nr:type II restriction endonuclease subunit R [Flavobacterium restrictum]
MEDLFEKIKVKYLKFKTTDLPSEPTKEFILPALTAGIQNQGLNNFVPKENTTILKNVISISANGANTGATFYQNKEFTVLQDAYAINWIYTNNLLTENHYLYLTSSISKTILGNYDWSNKAGWEKIKSKKIQLPKRNGNIDFDFMDTFISQLENERLAKLETYLSINRLKDYTLTSEEQEVLKNFDNEKFDEFNVLDIFDVKNTKNILSRDIIENSGEIPYLCASTENNAISSYISYDEKYLDKGNCVFIGGKTFVVTYQENDFYSNDSHNLILNLRKEDEKNKLNQLYLATCINKSLGRKYSWGDSISNRKIQTEKVSLPVKNKQPNYKLMEILISAIQKLVIKEVVLYTDRKIAATQIV